MKSIYQLHNEDDVGRADKIEGGETLTFANTTPTQANFTSVESY